MERMFTFLKSCRIFLFCIYMSVILWSNVAAAQPNTTDTSNQIIQVYIDYAESDNTERFIRSEILFVSYVRDPFLADIHVLITDQSTGGGGRHFTINFIGKNHFADLQQKLEYISPQSDSDSQRREGLTQIIKMGLLPYVSQTQMFDNIDIKYDYNKFDFTPLQIYDPWNYWIFGIELGGGLQAEKSRNAYNIYNSLSAERITEELKLSHYLYYAYEEQNFSDDGKSLSSALREWKLEIEPVKSISAHWSTGIFAEIYSTTYRNIKLGWSLAPAIEYNIFPWPEVEYRRFTLSYRAGYSDLKYIEETLFDKFQDKLIFHAAEAKLKMTQPWGNIDFEVEALHYPELKDTYSLEIDIEFAFRMGSGFDFVLESNIESIHDQIYLPKGEATIDEILLRRRQLATTYDVSLGLGIRFTFGSIYNNIINRRL